MRLYGLNAGTTVIEVFDDEIEAEFALLDGKADDPELAADLTVVEIEAQIVRVVARS